MVLKHLLNIGHLVKTHLFFFSWNFSHFFFLAMWHVWQINVVNYFQLMFGYWVTVIFVLSYFCRCQFAFLVRRFIIGVSLLFLCCCLFCFCTSLTSSGTMGLIYSKYPNFWLFFNTMSLLLSFTTAILKYLFIRGFNITMLSVYVNFTNLQ